MATLFPPRAAPLPAATRVVDSARRHWRYGVLLRGSLFALAAAVAVATLLVLLDLALPLPAAAREVLRLLPPALAGGILAALAYRLRYAASCRTVALRVEEGDPSLENRLLTALETPAGGGIAELFRADAERRLQRVDVRTAVPLRLRRPAVALAIASLPLAAGALLVPGVAAEAWTRWAHPADAYDAAWHERRAAIAPVAARAEPAGSAGFDELRWRVRPPAYTGQTESRSRDGDGVSALAGSHIELRGRFHAGWEEVRSLRVVGGDTAGAVLPVRRGGREWIAEWVLAPGDRGLLLEARGPDATLASRVVALNVEVDLAPDVVLHEPAEDLVLAGPRGQVPVRAVATDDFGVAELRLGWIRTRGSGESYTFEEGEWGWQRLSGEGRDVSGEFVLDLAAIDSRPGDVLHLRATARDRNVVAGPGEGVSETRVLRIALPDEMHTVTTLIGAPLELEQHPLLSQRMLILLTERLRDRAPMLAAAELRHDAEEIADDQGRLRSRVGEQIFARSVGGVQEAGVEITFEDGSGHAHGPAEGGHAHGAEPRDPREVEAAASEATGTGTLDELGHRHDEAPILDVDRGRMAIYNAMWAAERALRQGEPAAALPHQYEALRLIQEARTGARVFARGRVRAPPVDVEGARGTGKLDDASPARRTPSAAVPSLLPWLAELDSLRAALDARPPDELSLGLSALASRLLADASADPRAAALVSRAADAALREQSRPAAALLLQARRLLEPPGSAYGATALPSGTDPAAAEYLRRLGAQ